MHIYQPCMTHVYGLSWWRHGRAAREAAVAARGPTVVLEVDGFNWMLSRSLHRSEFGCVCVPVGPVAGAAWGAGDQICADCHSRRSTGSMVQCRMCVRWYHRSCGGGSQASAVDWVCKACDVLLHQVVPHRMTTAGNGARAHGAPAGPSRRCMIFLSFFHISHLPSPPWRQHA
jgi:hypothetical protein